MDVLHTMKRGGVVRLACKPHELVVAGSNPAPASIILAVCLHKNQGVNVEKISAISKSFLKRSSILPRFTPLIIAIIFHRLVAFVVRARECTLLHGVDILS